MRKRKFEKDANNMYVGFMSFIGQLTYNILHKAKASLTFRWDLYFTLLFFLHKKHLDARENKI